MKKTLLDEFLYGSGDSHAAYAKAVFTEELKDELINSKNISKAQRIVEKAITTTSYCDKGHEYIDKIEGGKDNTTCAILKRK